MWTPRTEAPRRRPYSVAATEDCSAANAARRPLFNVTLLPINGRNVRRVTREAVSGCLRFGILSLLDMSGDDHHMRTVQEIQARMRPTCIRFSHVAAMSAVADAWLVEGLAHCRPLRMIIIPPT